MCSNVETNLSWTCLVSGLLSFEHPSVLLFCLLTARFHKTCQKRKSQILKQISALKCVMGAFTMLTVFLADLKFCFRHSDPIVVQPGDELRVSCVFNSKSRRSTTIFGEGTDSEMCFTFLKYYPKENVPTPMCIAYKGIDTCKLLSKYSKHFPDGIKGCSFNKFASFADPETVQMVFSVRFTFFYTWTCPIRDLHLF